MVRRNLDDIEIVEPPLGELTKTHSHKRACFTGCGCIVFLIITIIIGLKIYIGPGPQTLQKVPTNFPTDIPIYDRNNIEEITFISGQYKNIKKQRIYIEQNFCEKLGTPKEWNEHSNYNAYQISALFIQFLIENNLFFSTLSKVS